MIARLGIVLLLASCTIDPVARAELSGEATGEAVFQQSGTSDQVSYLVELAGVDGVYSVDLAEGSCATPADRLHALGTLEITAGVGRLTGVTTSWEVATGTDRDVVGRAVIAERAAVVASCGEIFNSD